MTATKPRTPAYLLLGLLILLFIGALGAGIAQWVSSEPVGAPARPEEPMSVAAAPESTLPPPPSAEGLEEGGREETAEAPAPSLGEEVPADSDVGPAPKEVKGSYEREKPDAPVRIPGASPGVVPIGPGTRVPGFRPMGRTKYARAPPDPGNSFLEGVVRDRAGQPVSGADVYRLEPGVDRPENSVVSFGDLRRIARTGKDGAFRGRGPGGTYLVVANLRNLLNRRRGMDTSSGVTVTLPDRGTRTGIELRLSFALHELARIRGRLLDPEGLPVRRAEVFVDYFRAWTDQDGRFEVKAVLPGKALLSTRKTGYAPLEREVEVGPGETMELELELERKEGGSLILAGTVRNTDGEPLPGAYVYVMEPGRTLRSGRPDEVGRFEFRGLPDRLAESGADITVHAKDHISSSRTGVAVPSGHLDIVLEQAVRVRLLFRNQFTKEPLPQFRLELRRSPEAHPFRTSSPYSKDGSHHVTLPAGTVHLFVEAPEMEPKTETLELAPSAEVQEIVVELIPAS